MNSAGSAEQENAVYMESLEGKLSNLNSAWQKFSTNTLNSDFIKRLLDVATNLIKIADAAGGLTPILTTLVGAFALFKAGSVAKGITELIDKFSKFKATVQELGGGFKNFQLVLAGVKTAEDAAKISTVGLAVAAQTLTAALGIIGVVLGIATTAYNLFINKQNEARQASIDNANTHLEEANSLKKKAEEEDNNITKLENEKKALEKLSNVDDGTKEKIENKQKEIDKRKENIQKIKEEQKAEAKKAVGDVSGQKGQNTAGGIHAYIKTGVEAEDKKLAGYVKDFNVAIKEADGNTGKYNKTIDDMKSKYSALLAEQKKNNEAYVSTEKFLQLLNREQQKNADNYEKDAELAEVYYNALMNGLSEAEAGQSMVDWMQEFYGLNEEQMEQLEQGIDVKNEDATATENQNEKQQALNETINNAKSAQTEYTDALNDNIDEMINYGENLDLLKTAQEEIANTGNITAETFKSLSDNNLLQYLTDVDGQLGVNIAGFENSTEAIKQNALANLEASTYEQIRSVVLEDVKNKEADAATEAQNASTALGNAGTSAQEMGKKMMSAAGDVATLNAQLASIGGAGYTPGEDVTKKVQDILKQAQSTKDFISKWKPSTSKSATSKKSGGSGKKSGSGSSKSTKEEYKAEIDTLYTYENALDNAKDAVDRLNDALKDTDNFNEQEKILRQLIDATNNQINKTNELKNAQSAQMNDYINQLRAQGFAIDYNASKNELFINNMQHLADFSGDTAKNLEKLIKKIQDLNDDNRSLDSSVRDLTGDVKDYYEQLEEIPEKKLKRFNELMKEFQQGRLDQIQNQIDDIQHEMNNDPRLKQLEEQIEALEKQNDEIDKQKELEEKLLAVEEAKEKLSNARKQKILQVYRAGQGFVWESDIDSIKDAADELKDAQDDLNDKIRQDQIDQLQAEKDALEKSYQDRIDALQAFLDEQNYQIDKANREGIQSFQDLQKELAKFGLDSAEYLGKATDWLNNYNKSLAELNTTVSGILSSSTTATDGLIYSSATQDRINQALSNLIPLTTSTGLTLSNIDYDKIKGNSDNSNIYINNIELPNVKDVNDFVEALKDLPRLASSQATNRT